MPVPKATPESIARFGHIAAFLRKELKDRDWSQSELTKRLGANSTSVLAPWIQSRGAPGPDYRKKLAEVFGVEESFFESRSINGAAPKESAPISHHGGIRPGSGRQPTKNRVLNFALNADGTAHISLDLQTSKQKGLEILQFLLNAGIEPQVTEEEEL